MKLIFFGTSDFSRPVFEALKKSDYSPTLWDLGNPFESFKKMNPDICVVAAYGKIIPKEYLGVPKFGFLNVHPSLLPKYRGASPIQAAILNGDEETGVTIILMDEKVDHGPILAKREFSIFNFQFSKYKNLEKKLAELGAKLLVEILPKWVNGEIKPTEQNHNEATFTKKFSWPDGKVDWQKSAEEIERKIRALNPEPGTWALFNDKVLKIFDAEIIESNLPAEPGKIMKIDNQIIVKCGENALILNDVQPEGRKRLKINDFVRGHRDFIGSKLT